MASTVWPGSAYDDQDDEQSPGPAAPVQTGPQVPAPGRVLGAPAVPGAPEPAPSTEPDGVELVAVPATAGAGPVTPVLEQRPALRAADLLSAPDPGAGAANAPVTGWRRGVRVLSAGLVRPRPSRQMRELGVDLGAVGAQWAGPRTVVVANPKGAGGKTPTVVGLAATFGRHRGGRVLAWDNNETMGTLGIRTFPQRYANTAVDLLAALDSLTAAGTRAGDIAAFVRHQASGGFDVLVSDEDPGRMSQVDAEAFRRLHTLLTKVYELVVVDTGNNVRSANFLAAIDVCDALVLPLSLKADSVTSAGRLIDQLRAYGRADLVARAVTVISGAPSSSQEQDNLARWRSFFTQHTAAVIDVPFDAHLNVGGPIDFDQLAEPTRRAYLRASARVAEVLSIRPGRPSGRPTDLWESL